MAHALCTWAINKKMVGLWPTRLVMASDRMRKKIKDYAEIFGHIMRKHALIMRKLHRIMRKLKQAIKLIIRPVQCIYMLTVNP